MEQQTLEQAVIKIASTEFTNWGLKIKDEKGLIYNISQFKKGTEEETVAYQYITGLPKNGLGMTKGVKFVVVGNNQGWQSRYVRIIEDAPESTQSTQTSQMTKGGSNIVQKDDAFGKCKFGFLIEAFKVELNSLSSRPDFGRKQLEVLCEEWAEMAMRKIGTKQVQQPQPVNSVQDEDFPAEDEVRVENIPF